MGTLGAELVCFCIQGLHNQSLSQVLGCLHPFAVKDCLFSFFICPVLFPNPPGPSLPSMRRLTYWKTPWSRYPSRIVVVGCPLSLPHPPPASPFMLPLPRLKPLNPSRLRDLGAAPCPLLSPQQTGQLGYLSRGLLRPWRPCPGARLLCSSATPSSRPARQRHCRLSSKAKSTSGVNCQGRFWRRNQQLAACHFSGIVATRVAPAPPPAIDEAPPARPVRTVARFLNYTPAWVGAHQLLLTTLLLDFHWTWLSLPPPPLHLPQY